MVTARSGTRPAPPACCIAVGGVATLQRAIDETLADMQQCKVFGQPLMAVQNTRFKLAEYQFLASVLRCFVDSRRTHAIVAAVEAERGHRDRRLQGQRRLDIGNGQVFVHQAETVAVGVDHHVDEVGVVEGRCAALEARFVQRPSRRPLPRQHAAVPRRSPAKPRRPRSLW